MSNRLARGRVHATDVNHRTGQVYVTFRTSLNELQGVVPDPNDTQAVMILPEITEEEKKEWRVKNAWNL